MPLYDVSVPLCATTPTYPGDPGIEITNWLKLASGDPANVTFIKFGAHTGTHVDAPAHFIEGGNHVESLPLEVLIGEAIVFEVPDTAKVIDEDAAARACAAGATRVLFKTRNSEFWSKLGQGFRSDYTYIDVHAARLLVERGVRLVGIDYLSVEKFQSDDFATHHLLLSHGVVIVEGLDLREVPAGRYELFCLPLRIRDGSGDGAPARAVLRSIE
ncbi:MAG TPA: cyclase family protein [Pyrinomonadaceae bacterium]|nr:cyclase family protein [Pyrinomonadaceae bacterium]